MSQPQRNGMHPLDAPLHESSMLAWIAPSLQLLVGRIVQIAPFALAMATYFWLAPKLMLSSPFQDSWWREFIDGAVRTIIVTAIALSGYATLARTEGRAHGVGAILPLPDCAIRLLMVSLFWAIAGWLLSEVLQAILTSTVMLRLVMNLVRMFDVWGIYAVLLALSPLLLMISAVNGLSHIGAVRSHESLGSLLANSFVVVFGQARRFIVPSLVIGGALILIGHAIGRVFARNLLQLLFQHGLLIVMIFAALVVMFALPWWFVMERALRPELGVEDDLDPIPDMDAASEDDGTRALPPSAAAITSTSVATNTTTATQNLPATPTADEVRSRFEAMVESEGALMASRRLVAELRGRRLDQSRFLAGLEALPADAPVLAEMAGLADNWQESNRPGELAWLVRTGLKRDKAFLMDRPDTALAVAQRLVGQQQPQLASHLLLAFLNQHRRHPSHLDAGLRLARLLAFQLDNTDGAKRLLDKLNAGYPDNTQIEALRRTLP